VDIGAAAGSFRAMTSRCILSAVAGLGLALAAGSAQAQDVTPSFAGAPAGWTVDRYAPAGFQDVGTFQGVDHTLGITIDSSTDLANRLSAYQSTFYNTQGMGTPINGGGAGSSVTAYLWVPQSWSNPVNGSIRTDMWLVVNDPGAPSADKHAYPIIGFTNNPYTTSSAPAPFVGFRAWDDVNGTWNNLSAPVNFDAWNKLSIAMTTDISGNVHFLYDVNDTQVADILGTGTETTFSSLLMQAYNYNDPSLVTASGLPDGGNPAYTADWATDTPEPASMAALGAGLAGLAAVRRRRKG
jgi:hypothetical protein